MTPENCSRPSEVSRRSLLRGGGVLGAAALLPGLDACGSGAGSSSEQLKYWDTPFGTTSYNTAARKLVGAYRPAKGLPGVGYQEIQWSNFTTTSSSAIDPKTGPAVIVGGDFHAFQFAQQGSIAYADDVIDAFRKDGTYDDFLPGTIEVMTTKNGYAALPWELDPRVWWYRKSLLDEAGVQPPTTWDEVLPTFQAQTQKVKVIREWQPLAKTWAARSTEFSPLLAEVDGGHEMTQFTQTMVAGRTDARTALVSLQRAPEAPSA